MGIFAGSKSIFKPIVKILLLINPSTLLNFKSLDPSILLNFKNPPNFSTFHPTQRKLCIWIRRLKNWEKIELKELEKLRGKNKVSKKLRGCKIGWKNWKKTEISAYLSLENLNTFDHKKQQSTRSSTHCLQSSPPVFLLPRTITNTKQQRQQKSTQ